MIPPLPLASTLGVARPAGTSSPLPLFPDLAPRDSPPARGPFAAWRGRVSRLPPLDAPGYFAEPGPRGHSAESSPLPPLDAPRESSPPGTPRPEPPTPMPGPAKDYTDDDLAEVIGALIPSPGFQAPFPMELPDFEAILRSSFRRALAEHTASPFDRPDFIQRCRWRFDALLTSRSYEEILDEKTHRFRIEEVYLFDPANLSLISFASTDPARHASARKVGPTAHRLAAEIREPDGRLRRRFAFGSGRRVMVRNGGATLLAALVRGEPDPLTGPDLDYAMRRIEERFAAQLREGAPLLHELQSFLEECLLIHSPAPPPAI